jgi:hypothetical protein
MPTINYSFTKYVFHKDYTDPLPWEDFQLIRSDKSTFYEHVKSLLEEQFQRNRSSYPVSSFCYDLTKWIFILGVIIGIIYLALSDGLSSSAKGVLETVMVIGYIILSFSIIGSLSYWRSKRQLSILENSVKQYYSFHESLAVDAADYEAYKRKVAEKRDFFETLGRRRKFFENQEL